MSRRILYHILFWISFMAIYVVRDLLFAGPSDLAYPFGIRVLRFFFGELSVLPWKAVPFYALFYVLIPRYFSNSQYLKTAFLFLLILGICILGYRSVVAPVNEMLYGETPDYNVYSFRRFLFTLTDLLPALGLASTVKLLKSSIVLRRREAALRHEKQTSELRFLKAQTNPHFLFNTLNNLYGLARRNDPQVGDYILRLSDIVRYILQECSTDSVPIQKEVKVIEDYLALEALRYDKRLRVSFEMDVQDMSIEIPPLIMLPFVENAFKHGVSETREDAFVEIRLTTTPALLHFQVKNSFNPENKEVHEGIGLENVRRQLELIYDSRYTLQVVPAGNVYIADLNIHLN